MKAEKFNIYSERAEARLSRRVRLGMATNGVAVSWLFKNLEVMPTPEEARTAATIVEDFTRNN